MARARALLWNFGTKIAKSAQICPKMAYFSKSFCLYSLRKALNPKFDGSDTPISWVGIHDLVGVWAK